MNCACPVCGGEGRLLDVIDASVSCVRPQPFELSGVAVYYAVCAGCGYCWSPTMRDWPLSRYASDIYNDGYGVVDPDYAEARPVKQAGNMVEAFGAAPMQWHLDYGGGDGRMSRELKEKGWNSHSFDPFHDYGHMPSGVFDVITAIEVFEHVPEPHRLFTDLAALTAPEGIVIFTTLLSDGQLHTDERIKWWYIAPRNGHVSIWSKKSLEWMVRKYGFNARSSPKGFHVLFRGRMPEWAGKLL